MFIFLLSHHTNAPIAPPLPHDLLSFNRSGKSPARRSIGQLSPFHHQKIDDSGIACKIQKTGDNNRQVSEKNKENTNKLNITVTKASPTSAEILTTAKKIMSKRETPSSNFKTLKEKFETNPVNSNNVSIAEEFLTPKLLIKKFEAMSSSKENANNNNNNTTRRKAIQFQTPKLIDNDLNNQKPPSGQKPQLVTLRRNSDNTTPSSTVPLKARRSSLGDNLRQYHKENEIDDDDDDEQYDTSINKTLTPKVIREKFEQMKKRTSLNSRESSEMQFSLTNVTSMSDQKDDNNLLNNDDITENFNDDDEEEPIYEELNLIQQSKDDDHQNYIKKQQIIANFKLDEDEFIDEDDTDEIYENTSSLTDINMHHNLESTNRTESISDLKSNFKTDLDSISSFDSTSTTTTQTYDSTMNNNNSQETELFSIKDYRKQSKKQQNLQHQKSLPDSYSSSQQQQQQTQIKLNTRKSSMLNSLTNGQSKINVINEKANNSRNERIKELEELIKKEDNIITQAGSALEQCLSNSQFNGSNEHIECNTLLLISCQKRQAYLTEIQRLRLAMTNSSSCSSISTISSNDDDLSGTLIFSDIQLPVRESYLSKLKSGQEKRVFYFICLLRYGIQVLQTQVISVQELLSTRDTTITFPNRMAISNVDVNFKVKIDIYAMEMLPKDKHKKSPTKTREIKEKFFSPFKAGVFSSHHSSNTHHHNHHIDSHLHQQSNNLKSSNFIHIDTVEIMHKDLSRNNFKLNISSSSIPLTGYLNIQVRCMPSKSIELRGFLTMFEDVSGYGSWDRRWCMLSNSTLSYWKYPEDEYKKSPLGSINLIECTNDKVHILSRDICARKYTFELQCMKSNVVNNDNEQQIKADSIISKSFDSFKFTKNWLSADTRENANDWITHINWALCNLRLWNPNAMKPIKK